MKTIQRELHAANIHGRVAIPNPSFGVECYEETRVVPRPPKLVTLTMGTSHLVSWILIYIIPDHRTRVRLLKHFMWTAWFSTVKQ
ncbi:hypothetical protein TNCV_80661 [Trichonephila clavipes]|nr:hypothetical protein TNCV_80661 [Trichonephila clavipes]